MHLRIHHDDDERTASHREIRSNECVRAFAPPVDREAIFTHLIEQELRSGRLNRKARARIVRYACGMGLSATRAGELVRECVDRLAREHDNPDHIFALRILDEPQRPKQLERRLKAVVTIATGLLCYLLWWKLKQ